MKKIFSLLSLLLVLNTAFPQSGTNLRGQVRTVSPTTGASVPLPRIAIDLYKKDAANNKWILVAATVSDQNGFYYFNRIAEGNYFIQVNKLRNYDIAVVRIDERRQSFQDLPLLLY